MTPRPRSPLFLLLWLAVLLAPAVAFAFELPAHTVSTSKQFTVFAEDRILRSRVSGFAEENKRELLSLLDQKDNWKTPILISFRKADPSKPRAAASQVTLFDTGHGMKLQIDVLLGAAPDEVALQSRLVEALLLEQAYRGKTPRQGVAYRRPPAWLVEGVTERIRRKLLGGSDQVFEALLDANHLPPLSAFLDSAPNGSFSTWTRVFRAGSLALLNQIVDLPHGRKSLRRLIDGIPESRDGALAHLEESLVSPDGSELSLEKWWSLSVAKMAAADRYQGADLDETERRLQAILQIKLKKPDGKEQSYSLKDFRAFYQADGAALALVQVRHELVELSARGNALYRGVLGEYEEVVSLLLRRKVDEVAERLMKLAFYRKDTLKRIDAIADYLNWMEGTQLSVRSNAFEGYFNAAREVDAWRSRRSDPVTAYMDLVDRALPPAEEEPAAVAQSP